MRYFICIATALAIFVILACLPATLQIATVVPDSSMPTPIATQKSWIILDLPANATQLERGAEIYRLVCSACHAYDGTGLTDQWRATWDEKSQNCWQSKCHSLNHPDEGFVLPMSPPIVGAAMPARFKSVAALNDFIYTKMPWHDPKSLTIEESWAVTAYVMKLNGMTPPNDLNPLDAQEIAVFSTVTIDPALKLSIPPVVQRPKISPTQTEINDTNTPPVKAGQKVSTGILLPVLILISAIIILIALSVKLLKK
jgi:mono/diheme cytochrome c family protein